MFEHRVGLITLGSLLIAACSENGQQVAGVAHTTQAGIVKNEHGWLLTTGELTIEPSEERYVCYATRATEDMVIGRFSSGKALAVHHFQLNESNSPEPDGFAECERFPSNWSPLYTATTVAAELRTPDGSARRVAKGAQLILQTHLLNFTAEPITTVLQIQMDESLVPNPEPVGILGFGSANIVLPPGQTTTIENICRLETEARIYQIVPHMHLLGRRMELELGADENSLERVYVRDPFDFNDQHFDPLDLTIPAGTVARVRCTYENATDRSVRFGESSRDEMCNLAAFVAGHDGVRICTRASAELSRSVPRATAAGVCGATQSKSGLGRLCAKDGDECGQQLSCTADVLDAPLGVCVQIGCNSNADCDGGTCCAPAGTAGVANVCTIEACRPDDCVPVGPR